MLTRRGFMKAAAVAFGAGVPGMAAAGEVADQAQGADSAEGQDATATADDAVAEPADVAVTADSEPEPEPVDDGIDAEGNVSVLINFQDLTEEDSYDPVATFQLPVGCSVFCDSDQCAAVLKFNDGGNPMTHVGCLDYATGELTWVLTEPMAGDGFSPSEVHITDVLMTWVEIHDATDEWVLYAVPFGGEPVTGATRGLIKLDEGDAEWLPAQVTAYDRTVVWQHMPDPSGPLMTEASVAYRWSIGSSEGTPILESKGRFSAPPHLRNGVLTLTPRADDSDGIHYAVTAFDVLSMVELDSLTMPVSVKPFRATRVNDKFAFSVEANYGYGGRLGNMGYYIGRGLGPFNYVSREPSAQVCHCNNLFVVKSQLSYFVIDMQRCTYRRIVAANGCVDYGDYPASEGAMGTFVTYAAVKDDATGIPSHVLVRVFSL